MTNEIDISITEKTLSILRNMIGKKFKKFRSDPFIFSPSVFGIVGIFIDGKSYSITSLLEEKNRFFEQTEVAVLKIVETEDKNIVSKMDGGAMVETPVMDTIQSISVVNDIECVTHNEDKRVFKSSKGIIFHMKSGNEISFEIGTWFSEFITIMKGYDLIQKFTPIGEFIDEWDETAGYIPEVSREIIRLK